MNRKSWLFKKVSFASCLLLLVQLVFGITSSIKPVGAQVAVNESLCSVDVDVVLVLDRSGSMNDGESLSACDWGELELVNTSYQCVSHHVGDLDEEECLTVKDIAQFPTSCLAPVYTPPMLSKFAHAEKAANDFLSHLGANDQSALVSFTDSASLDRSLTNIHSEVLDLTIEGATNMGDAVNLANIELGSANANPQAVKAVILLTDGKANKPNGNGIDENALDVAYVESVAVAAANLGYKIFTIGLGDDVNEMMLQNIASMTGAEYYKAPTASQLQNIYDLISNELCTYGSISGCKYNDVNNDATINGIDTNEAKLDAWEILLYDGVATTSQVTVDGCYSFAGLDDGDYILTEVSVGDWIQTYPSVGYYSITISGHNNAVDIDFANYLEPLVVTSSISGYKYEDFDNDISSTSDWVGAEDWIINLFNGVATTSTTTDSSGYFEFPKLTDGAYYITETIKSTWLQLLAPTSEIIIDGGDITDNNFVNYFPYCGNDVLDFGEQCDGGDNCDIYCLDEGGNNGDDEWCGDGILQTSRGEECDDGNQNNSDACSDDCQLQNYCGDDVCDSDETCSNCSSDCGSCGGGSTPLCILRGDCESNYIPPVEEQVEEASDEVLVLGEEGEPALTITKGINVEITNPGNILNYSILVTNNGNLEAFNVNVSDTLPDGLVFTEDESINYSWSLGDIPAGESRNINYQVKVLDSILAGVYENIAVVSADNHDELSTSADVEVIVPVVLAETGMDFGELSFLLIFSSTAIIVARKLKLKSLS